MRRACRHSIAAARSDPLSATGVFGTALKASTIASLWKSAAETGARYVQIP